MDLQELTELKMEKPGFFSKIANVFTKSEHYEDEDIENALEVPTSSFSKIRTASRYQITVRRQVLSFQDAIAAADGLKRGEQQIINLTVTDKNLREKIKDFMCGINYALEGSWEEIGENIYLLAPTQAMVEVAPTSTRMTAMRN